MSRFAVLAVEVEEAAKATDESQRNVAYFSVLLGEEGPAPEGETLPPEFRAPTAADFERAAPVDTRVVALGSAIDHRGESHPDQFRVENPQAGLPDGAALFGLSPQGSLLETGSGGTDTIAAEPSDLRTWTEHAASLAGNEATGPDSPGSFQNLVDEPKSSGRRIGNSATTPRSNPNRDGDVCSRCGTWRDGADVGVDAATTAAAVAIPRNHRSPGRSGPQTHHLIDTSRC